MSAAGITGYDANLVPVTSTPSPVNGVYFGTGNSNGGFTTDTENGVELGLRADTRYGATIDSSTDTYTVTTGTASGGALWDWVYSIDLQPTGPNSGLNLSGIVASMTITDGTQTLLFNPIAAVSGYNGTTISIGDDSEVGPLGVTTGTNTIPNTQATTAWAAQNAENISFFAPAFNPNALDTYTITLNVADNTTDLNNSVFLASDTIVVDAVAPEPTTLILLPAGALALFMMRRRRIA